GLGQQGLAGAGRANHQHAARDLAAEALELAGIAQELDQLRHLFLGLVDPRHIGEGHPDLVLGHHPRPALAERHGPTAATAALHLPHEEDPDADQQQEREPGNEYLQQQAASLGLLGVDDHAVFEQRADQGIVIGLWAVGPEPRAGRAHAGDDRPLHGHLADAALLHFLNEVRVGDLAGYRVPILEIAEHGHEDDGDNDPEDQILGHVIQGTTPRQVFLRAAEAATKSLRMIETLLQLTLAG